MFEQWIAMENFYYLHFPSLMIAMILLAMVSVAIFYHRKEKIFKIIWMISFVPLLALAFYTFSQYKHYNHLIQTAAAVNAGVRDIERNFYTESDYSHTEKSIYRDAYNLEDFEQLGFYEAEEVQEHIEYLGRNADKYYFILTNNRFYVNEDEVEFTDELTTPYRIGLQYSLTDKQFESIGFVKESNIFQVKYRVPSELKNIELEDSLAMAFSPANHQVNRWYVP